ncbi:tetratricopeptide repeat protein [Flaviaesturariibacter flavus]|uniref:histidine kinase n=1 Tax=Flaviaesturariibacter flavus TaxID=2502780 RepID=A0A4V2NVI5_9BACT|nr:tetratricopeptide repeat protein [Flaviaesturariibacter flavus]TCJ13602.1 tetratricopeptide repeat protein [Flaviaesturariibacter flavus]
MRRLCVILLLLSGLYGSAQQAPIDSLLAIVAANPRQDSAKVMQLTAVLRQYARMKNYTQMEAWGARAVEVARALPGQRLLPGVYRRLAVCYHGAANYLAAVGYYEKAIAAAQRTGDKPFLAGIYLNLSALYSSITDYPKSLDASQQAINLYNEMGDTENASSSYMNIGIVYGDMQQQDKAIEYKRKALAIFNTVSKGLHYGTALAYSSLAGSLSSASDADLRHNGIDPAEKRKLALEYLQQALYITEHAESAKSLQAEVYTNIARWYQDEGNLSSAARHFELAVQIARRSGDIPDLVNVLLATGSFGLRTGELDRARAALLECLRVSAGAGILSNEQEAAEALSTLYERKGMADSALYYFRSHVALKEQVLNAEKEKDITRRQLKLDFSIRENDYRLQQQLTDGKLKQQLLLAAQRQQQLLVEQQKVELISKEKDLQRLSYLQRQQALQIARDRKEAELDKHLLRAGFERAESNRKISSQQLQLATDKKVQGVFIIALLLLTGLAGLIFYDRAKTRRLNRIINAQKEELQQLSVVKDKIFGVVSHDMRAPVSSLVSFIQLLEGGNLRQEKLAAYAGELKSSLTHTSTLMNNLLIWAASQMKGFRASTEPVALRPLAEEVLHTISHHLESKHVQLQLAIPENLVVHTDRNMLSVVLRNLLSNAAKYANDGGTVGVRALSTGKDVCIDIIDDGIGMSEEMAARFNSNYTGVTDSRRGTANEKGTGLGLLLCKTFVEQLQGSITASRQEQGTRFSVTLPNS